MSITDSNNSPKRGNKWVFILVGVVFFFVVSWAIICIPQYQVSLLRARIEAKQNNDFAQQIQLEKDYVDYANKARTTLAQIVGGLLFLFTAGAAVWTAIAAQKNAQAAQTNAETAQQNLKLAEKTAQENLEHTRDGKITERFSKAVEMLGSERLEVRLGGIYALERIARDSQPDHWTVMEVLTAFIREYPNRKFSDQPSANEAAKTPSDPTAPPPANSYVRRATIDDKKIPTDIQAALMVIGRRKWVDEETSHQRLDLRKAALKGAELPQTNFLNVEFIEANLVGANLAGANFTGANLTGANLTEANLIEAKLSGANLAGAKLSGANLNGAKLIKADLFRAILARTNLNEANLSEANLSEVICRGTKFFRANFSGTKLTRTKLAAKLSETIGLTWEQVLEAEISSYTDLPPKLAQQWREKAEKERAEKERIEKERLESLPPLARHFIEGLKAMNQPIEGLKAIKQSNDQTQQRKG